MNITNFSKGAFALLLTIGLAGCDSKKPGGNAPDNDSLNREMFGVPGGNPADSSFRNANLILPGETHFARVWQLTNGGNNAEAYWSRDDSKICFQSDYAKWGNKCDQIFAHSMADTFGMIRNMPQRISTGDGRTTCSFFMPDGKHVIYASTHLADKNCPPLPKPRADRKYVWPIYDGFDIFIADEKGNITAQLTNTPGYDAEATVSPQGDKIVFTSMRSGDLELWTMDIDGKNQKQITNGLGYDGGAFFSPDGKTLVFRASRPKTSEAIKEYKDLLKQGQVTPSEMEIYTCNVDGSNLRQVTNLGHANWAPYFTPDGKKIVFSSNHKDGGYRFNLYMVNLDGSGLEQITHDETFAAFPMFSYNGKYLIFSSNRNNGGTRDTNLFLAEWK